MLPARAFNLRLGGTLLFFKLLIGLTFWFWDVLRSVNSENLLLKAPVYADDISFEPLEI